MSFPEWADITQAQEIITDVDFMQIDMVKQIEAFNAVGMGDKELDNRIATFWLCEDGLSSMEAFEDVVRQYHTVLKGL